MFTFWIVLFMIERVIFAGYHFDKIEGNGVFGIMTSLVHALPLDVSMAGYLSILPFLLMPFGLRKVINIYSLSLICLVALINTVDMALYDEWSTRLHVKAFAYLANPSEVLISSKSQPLWILLPLLVIQAIGGWWLYKRIGQPLKTEVGFMKASIITVAFIPLLFLGIRGGLNEMPVNESSAFWSGNAVLNHTSLNSPWSLTHSYLENRNTLFENPYQFMPEDRAVVLVDKMTGNSNPPLPITNVERPNILILIIEGLTADVVPSLGGIPDIVPDYEKLIPEGLFFTNFYATGMRSDKGIVGMISGFPGMPAHGISTQPNKFASLPTLNKDLRRYDYHSSFYFGGDLNYGNLKAYMRHHGFDKLVDRGDLPKSMKGNSLGVFDSEFLPWYLNEVEQFSQPFYSNVFTSSTHEPFEIPAEFQRSFHVDEEIQKRLPKNAMKYLDAVNYAQKHWHNFIQSAKRESWWSNTLIFIVSDHSHHLPRDRYVHMPRRHQIPLLVTGGALIDSLRGTTYDKPGSHIDLPATLLGQLGLPYADYPWSRDLFAPARQPGAYYSFIEGFGWVDADGSFSYDSRFEREMHVDSTTSPATIERGRAWMQMVFEGYLDL
jgi:phosphoglycerol transferase MdoB-like AlkP superfamily enzyme